MNWKKWTAIGIGAAVIIAIIVLHIVQPKISYAWAELLCFGTFVAGVAAGYLAKGHITAKNDGNKYPSVEGNKE